MTLATELEQTRMLSLLTESPQQIQLDDRRYVAYCGFVLPYSSFSTIFMWMVCGPKIYHSIWTEQDGAISTAKSLNMQDDRLQTLHQDHVGQYLADRFKAAAGRLGQDDMEEMLSTLLTAQG
jgi:hypothetical protein